MLLITIPSILAIEYPDKITKYAGGYYNMAIGIGMTAGPTIASILIKWFNYSEALFCFAGTIFTVGLLSVFLLPKLDNE